MLISIDDSSTAVKVLKENDPKLKNVIEQIGSISFDPYEEKPFPFLIHEIIEQMLSQKAGEKIYNRLVSLCGGTVTPDAISKLSDAEIKSIGTSNSKVKFIRSITNAVINNDINFDELMKHSDEDVFKTLTALPGIGSWTAKMYLIFVLNREDILPFEDVAFLQSYKWLYPYAKTNKKAIERNTKKWRPYRSIASRYLYIALDSGITKTKRGKK